MTIINDGIKEQPSQGFAWNLSGLTKFLMLDKKGQRKRSSQCIINTQLVDFLYD